MIVQWAAMRIGELLALDRGNLLLDEAALLVDLFAGALHEVAGSDG